MLAAARGLATVIFLCDHESSYVRGVAAEVGALATACDITGLSDDEILALADCAELDGIITFSERQIMRTARLAARRGLAFHDPDTARAVTDKLVQRRRLAEAGVQNTRCRLVREPAGLGAALDEVGLPAILKPRCGAGSARTCRVDTRGEAVARLREFGDGEFIVEQVLAGEPTIAGADWADYVSVESVTSHGRIEHIEITGKFPLAEPLRETGYVVPSTLGEAAREAVRDVTTRALRALGVTHGATHTEVKLGADEPTIIEVNGRVGGYVADLIRTARGFDLIRAALLAALGRGGGAPEGGYRRHAFQLFLTPPMAAVSLRGLDGTEELLARRGIHAVEVFKRPGDRIDWRDGTLAYVGIVHGAGADHHDVRRLAELSLRTLNITYELAKSP
ncbi:ATP-grasp domain-containing protein [Catenuloplanes sp. NPDC020197]|uniref:Biotin carboxylase n=1 Tax=Catenuloplanes niger TaxID=587534 RepID=A0AAE3ZYC1_9ACTN|nr:ATP-grasp domain-containing protein [Catenuloplanes niger]MDR7327474.1 biotin carboxylase [Catenuloplanes niger]